MARKKPISVAAAETKLRDATTHRVWGDWFLKVLENLPVGVDPAVLDAALEGYLETGALRDLRGLATVDDAIVRYAERHEHELPHAAFLAVALRTGRGPIGPRLHDLLEHTGYARADPVVLRAQIAARPEIVEGARAAEAISDPSSTTSPYLPILAVDGSPDSLDILLPRLEAACAKRDQTLDWVRTRVVPLFGDTPAARAVTAMLDGAAAERSERSPIWRFLEDLGLTDPPAIARFTVTFRDREQQPTLLLTVDSEKADWMWAYRKYWLDGPIAPTEIRRHLGLQHGLTVRTIDYVLRVGRGLDRDAIDRWVRTLMATPT